jgi:hypothetical protein
LDPNHKPDGSYTLEDWNEAIPDQEFENQPVHNPQTGLALLRRAAQAQLDIADAIGVVPPPYLREITSKLAPLNTMPSPGEWANTV